MRKGKGAKVGKKKRKWQFISIGIVAALALGLGFGTYNYIQNPPRTAGFGAVGSAHEHAALKLFINDEELVNFALPEYQVKSRFIHFEDGNAELIHRHATGVDLGFFFESVGISFDDRCIMPINAARYCNEEGKTLKLFVNGIENNKFDKYVLDDGDKILITYGTDNEDIIQKQISSLDPVLVPTGQQ